MKDLSKKPRLGSMDYSLSRITYPTFLLALPNLTDLPASIESMGNVEERSFRVLRGIA